MRLHVQEVLHLLKAIKLRLWSFKSIAVIEFGVNNAYGDGTDCFESVNADTDSYTNSRIWRDTNFGL